MKSDELSFITRLKGKVPSLKNDVVFGIGDDAAVVQGKNDQYVLLTTDVQIEGVHFQKEWGSSLQIGKKAVLAALNDISAMGGIPTHVLVSLAFPKKEVAYVEAIYKGLIEECRTSNLDIIGGNISSAREIVVSLTVFGIVQAKDVLYRNGARVGDKVLVTGELGLGAIAVEEKRIHVAKSRVKEAHIIAQSHMATAMIDISDGLSSDLLHICDASGVGVKLFEDKLPIIIRHSNKRSASRIKTRFWTSQNDDSNKSTLYALHGGEDYELCFTAKAAYAAKLARMVEKETGTKVSIIGEIIDKKTGRWIIESGGRKRPLKSGGWDHFSSK